MSTLQTKGKAVSSSVVSIDDFDFDAENLDRATAALISTDDILSFRFDGGDPTPTLGHLLDKYDRFLCPMSGVPQLKFIRHTGDCNVTITLMR